jgi:hypothetical protein
MSTARRGGVDNIILISGGAGDPEVLAGTVDPSAGGGVPAAEGSTFLRFAAGAGQSWLKIGALDTDWIQLAVATGDVSAVLEKWTRQNVPDSLVDSPLSALVSTTFDDIKMIRSGSIRGLSSRFTATITDVTAGSAVVRVAINGAPGTLNVPSSSGVDPTGGEATQAAGIDTFVAGDLISIQLTTLGTFAPTGPTQDLEAWLDVSY